MRAAAASLAAVALLGVAACGGGGGGGAGGGQPSGSIRVTMTEFAYNPSTIIVSHGKVVLFLVNAGTVSHDMIIVDSSNSRVDASDLVSPGDSTVVTIDNIAPGTYTFYCDQPGHRGSGMQGTLTVT